MTAIYLDHAATTPMHPDVLQAMIPVFEQNYGNPSSIHQHGRAAKKMVDEARALIARQVGAKPSEIIFTGGGTEADNMAIIGAARAKKQHGRHIITTKVEHHAVLNTCRFLESEGFEVTYLDVDERGKIRMDDLKAHLKDETILITIMYGNNEVGSIQPIKKVGELVADHQALFHTDAVQAFGVVDLDARALGVDLMSMTAHKINGPKGSGFLYVKDGTSIASHIHGGEQERRRRAGTLNVPGIVGTAKALELTGDQRINRIDKYQGYRNLFLEILKEHGVSYAVNGDLEQGLPHILNLYLPGTYVESLLMNLDLAGVSVSSGSACTAGSLDPSHVLTAMYGETSDRPQSSIRISFGLNNSDEEAKQAADILAKTVRRLVQ